MENSAVPKVSVIIPLYNKAPYIKRALDSVLAQTVQDFEVIVVNDGSKDGGEKIVEEYGDARVHLINQENQGVSAARNHGVDAAKAELVAFLDADDEWLPEFLETILRLRKDYPNAGMYGTNRIVVHSSPVRKETHIVCYGIDNDWAGILPSYFRISALGAHPVCTSSIAVPRDVFIDVHGFREDLRYYEDLDLYARIALFYDVAYCSKYMVHYMKDDDNAATRNLALIPSIHPIITSISALVDEGKLDSDLGKVPDLLLYIDSLNISQAVNRLPRDKRNVRKYLRSITHKELLQRKRHCYIHAILPEIIYVALCKCKSLFVRVIC